jgi:hypothetical protein
MKVDRKNQINPHHTFRLKIYYSIYTIFSGGDKFFLRI